MSEPGVEAPIGPVLAAPRRARDRARILGVAAIAVLLVGVGVGLVGNGSTEIAGATRSPGPSSTSTAPAGTPSRSDEPTIVSPTQNVDVGCAAVRLGTPPEIRVSSDAGNLAPVSGVAASAAPGSSGAPGSAWPIPGEDGAARLDGSSGLLLAPDGDACVRSVIAEYRPADPTLTGPFPVAFRNLDVSPPSSIVPLGPLPSGDWVVRIVATFSTGIPGQGDASVAERFFRVVSGSGSGPVPTPGFPPAIPCGQLATSASPNLTLAGTDQGEVAGIPSGAGRPEILTATLGAALEIRSAGDACARSWQILASNVDTGQTINIETQENPSSDPFRYAQNRWRLLNLPTGLLQMTATMGYSADVEVVRRWSVIVLAPDFPGTRFRVEHGDPVEGAQGCEATWAFASGTGGVRSCTDRTILDEVQTLEVPAGMPVHFEVTGGWTVLGWSATCGTLDPATTLDPFIVVDGCDLGGSQAPGPAVFLPRPGAPVVRMSVTVERDGITASDSVYVAVSISP